MIREPAPRASVRGRPKREAPRVILFDGVCNLCNGFIQFVIARDPGAQFRFGAITTPAAQALLHAAGVETAPDSIVLLEDTRVFWRSDAALRIARRLSFPWRLAYGLVIVPRFLRDPVYDFIAAHRYQWFGRRDVCMVPTPDLKQRFLD